METDGSLTVTLRDTNQPYCRIRPGYNQGIGPHVTFYRIVVNGEEEPVLILGVGGVNSLIRWLPMVLTTARRMGNRPPGKQRG